MNEQANAEARSPLGYWPTINALYHQQYRQSGLVTQLFAGRGAIDKALLNRALQEAQSHHPLLHCRIIEEDRQFVFEPDVMPDVTAIEFRSTDGQTGFDIAEQLMGEGVGERLWRIVFVESTKGENCWYLIMLCHHAICDAQSTSALLEDLLETYVAMEQGAKAKRPSPSRSVSPAGLAATVSEQESRASDCSVESEWPIAQFAPLDKRRVRWVKVPLNPDILDSLLSSCRREKVSLTNLIAAALIRASGQRDCCRVSTAIDFRNRFEPPVKRDQFGCFIGMVESTIPTAEGIWEQARQCRLYQFQKSDSAVRSAVAKPAKLVLKTLMMSRISNSLQQGNFAAGCAVSNLGVLQIPERIGSLHIDEIQFTSPQLAGLYSLFLSVVSHAGRIYMSISYADPLLSTGDIQNLMQKFVGELTACCP